MLPERVPLQIYVQVTLQTFARFFTNYNLLVGWRNMFSLDPYIVAQIAAFHGCDCASIRRRLMIILIVVHGFCLWYLCGSSFVFADAGLSYICGGLR